MRFEDKIQIKVFTYAEWYAVIGDKAYVVDDNGVITTKRADVKNAQYDKRGNPLTPQEVYFDLSNCFISFNSAAQKVRTHDGQERIYSYYVIMPLRKDIYHLIPREGDIVHIVKADGTIDTDKEVLGFVTYKKRYLKIWL